MALDFFTSNEEQQASTSFADKRFNRPIQMLKFKADAKGQRIDILPVSDTRTHAVIKQHKLPGCVVLCPTMFHKSCPLCDAVAMNRNDKWYWENFKTQDRALFNAIPLNKEGKVMKMQQEHTVPIYLYEVGAPQKKAQGFWLMLTSALSSTEPEDAFKKQFFSWDKGSTLKLTFTPDTFNGNEFAKVSGIEFVHPRNDYSKERAKWEPHLYKVPDIYQETDVEELRQFLESMKHGRGGGGGGYNPNLAQTGGGGFYAPGQQAIPGTTMYAAANDDADAVF